MRAFRARGAGPGTAAAVGAEAATGTSVQASRQPPHPTGKAGGGGSPPVAPIQVRRKVRKLRFLAILAAALMLGGVSFLYGMFIAITQDLPKLEDRYQFTHARNSVLLDDRGQPLAVLSEQHRILLGPSQIPRVVKDAVVAVEDKRFYSEPGIDPKGILRAATADLLGGGGLQGASTIAEQFVKNALAAQGHRTVFEKLREAALAFQLAHKWPKEKILAEYLNTIYFGEGAYGIEAAAETYFGHEAGRSGCGQPNAPLCVSALNVAQAAMLAGVIASPSAFDPLVDLRAARARRGLVLRDMRQQGYITEQEYLQAIAAPLPNEETVQPPQLAPVQGLQTGYFTSWVEQQLIGRYSATRALEGGLAVHTTLDLELQRQAEAAVHGWLPGPAGPSVALVAIENSTGDVRAMVGGRDFNRAPFNLATAGERQPGSSFKAFDLAAALAHGISPYSVWSSQPKSFVVPGTGGQERFYVHNDANAYAPGGSRSLIEATAYSDNAVYAEVGIKVGTGRIARLAHAMGIGTPISTNPSMTIGGLTVGVTPLDMAHAYETIAQGGQRIGSSLIAGDEPTGLQEVAAPAGEVLPDGHHKDVNNVTATRVLPAWVANEEISVLQTVIEYGTGKNAAIGQFAAGKTGTTTNYTDAWFVGFDHKYTVAVWVGYPDHPTTMRTDYNGGPVEGGTYPALIWHDFMAGALQVERERSETTGHSHGAASEEGAGQSRSSGQGGSGATATEHEAHGGAAQRTAPATSEGTAAGGGGKESGHSAPAAPARSEAPTATPEQPATGRSEEGGSSGAAEAHGSESPPGGGASGGGSSAGGAAAPSG